MSNSRRWRELVTWVYNYNAVRGHIPYDEIIAVIENIKRNEKPRPSPDNMVECEDCDGRGSYEKVSCKFCNGTGVVKEGWKKVVDKYSTTIGRYGEKDNNDSGEKMTYEDWIKKYFPRTYANKDKVCIYCHQEIRGEKNNDYGEKICDTCIHPCKATGKRWGCTLYEITEAPRLYYSRVPYWLECDTPPGTLDPAQNFDKQTDTVDSKVSPMPTFQMGEMNLNKPEITEATLAGWIEEYENLDVHPDSLARFLKQKGV